MLEQIIILGEEKIEVNIDIIKMVAIILYTYYTNFKISNTKILINRKSLTQWIGVVVIAILSGIIKHKVNYVISVGFAILMVSFIWNNNNINKSLLTTTISLSINYAIFLISIIFNFIINVTIRVNSNKINLLLLIMSHGILNYLLFQIRKFKYGFSFLKNTIQNEYIDILTLNICVIIVFFSILIVNSKLELVILLSMQIIVVAIIMFITIQKSLQLYYKQKLLVQELEETKRELENKTKEIEELEKENLNFSKKSHTLAHKQKSLEYKLQEIINKSEISKEEVGEVKDRLKEIEKDLYKEKTATELAKTEIPKIDDMLKYMQSECIKNKIDFELQIKGNIHHMTNNLISKEDLETLLADHIKNAIIAINHTENINRTILVKLGKIDEYYGLHIYDSGAEFEKETLQNIGKKPSTTHADEGGTGMGFMNTFDTLKKCNASLIIEEYNEPSKDNYTKAIIIKFNKNNEFKIKSYRELIHKT